MAPGGCEAFLENESKKGLLAQILINWRVEKCVILPKIHNGLGSGAACVAKW